MYRSFTELLLYHSNYMYKLPVCFRHTSWIGQYRDSSLLKKKNVRTTVSDAQSSTDIHMHRRIYQSRSAHMLAPWAQQKRPDQEFSARATCATAKCNCLHYLYGRVDHCILSWLQYPFDINCNGHMASNDFEFDTSALVSPAISISDVAFFHSLGLQIHCNKLQWHVLICMNLKMRWFL